jgi:hypothetical protein
MKRVGPSDRNWEFGIEHLSDPTNVQFSMLIRGSGYETSGPFYWVGKVRRSPKLSARGIPSSGSE